MLRYNLDSENLLKNLEGIHFESLSNNAKFKDTHALA